MTPEVRDRIEQIRHGNVPEGYKRIKDALVPAEWSTCKIGDFATISQGFTFSRDFQGNSNGNWNYFKVADIGLDSNGKYLTKALNTISDDIMHQIGCVPFKAGSIVFPRVGAALMNNNKKLLAQDSIVDDNVLVLSVTNANVCVNEFIYYTLQNMRLEDWCNTGLVPVINSKTVYKHTLHLPSVREQQKIAEILSAQDKVIELEGRKIEEIKKAKQFFLNKMFPKKGQSVPEIRFKGFTDAWEQRKLGDILQTLPFKAYLKSPEQDGRYEIIQQGSDPIIGYANGEPCRDYKNTVIFGDHTLSLYKPKKPFFVATDGVRIVKGSEKMDGNYLLPLLERNKPQSEGYKRYYSILADIDVFFTENHKEQSKIGEYFSELDHLITLHQRKLEEEKKKKKALMQLLLTGIVRV